MFVPFDNHEPKAHRAAAVESAIWHSFPGDWIDHVAFFCHGLRDSLQTGHRSRALGNLAQSIAWRARPGSPLVVTLYACDTARDYDRDRSDDTSDPEGGEGGFADALRDALRDAGAASGVARRAPRHGARHTGPLRPPVPLRDRRPRPVAREPSGARMEPLAAGVVGEGPWARGSTPPVPEDDRGGDSRRARRRVARSRPSFRETRPRIPPRLAGLSRFQGLET